MELETRLYPLIKFMLYIKSKDVTGGMDLKFLGQKTE